jgi:D-alanine-D-alanine ligase
MGITAVLFGGPSSEHDISILTGLQVLHIVAAQDPDAVGLYWTKTGEFLQVRAGLEARDFAEGIPAGARPLDFALREGGAGFSAPGKLGRRTDLAIDVVVNCCHGGAGEDGRLQGMLDLAGIAYTGPSANAAALGMDKLSFAALTQSLGLPSLPRMLVSPASSPDFAGPYIVKPRFGGSSIGIAVVESYDDALALVRTNVHMRAGGLLEPFRSDLHDLHVNVRTYPALQTSMVEKPARGSSEAGGIFSYEQKYLSGDGLASSAHERPAKISEGQRAAAISAVESLAVAMPLRGSARVDFLANDSELYVNEVNTIPGAMGLYLWRASGLATEDLIRDLLREATAVPAHHPVTAGADTRALLDADAIKRKLG